MRYVSKWLNYRGGREEGAGSKGGAAAVGVTG